LIQVKAPEAVLATNSCRRNDYAEAWENNPPTSRFLYTGGVQLCLFHNVLNVYAPLFYSSDFNDAMRGLDFWKKITFSIDIGNIPYKKMIRKAAMYE